MQMCLSFSVKKKKRLSRAPQRHDLLLNKDEEENNGLTLCVYRGHVAPAVSLDDVHHGSGLLHI